MAWSCMYCGHKCSEPKPKCPVCAEEYNSALPHDQGGTIYQHDNGWCHRVVSATDTIV